MPPLPVRRRSAVPAVVVALLALVATGAPALPAAAEGSSWNRTAVVDPGLPRAGEALQQVVVSGSRGVEATADAVRRAGGEVGARLHLVGGVEARVRADRLGELAGLPGVTAVTADREAALSEVSYDDATTASSFARASGATSAWAQGQLGQGVGVAVIDSGVSSVRDLAGRVVHGPDLSGEGLSVDTYGHGTVMAGAIAGSGASTLLGRAHTGVAPKAHVVAVKVAGRNGVVDVSTVLQAMHFVSAYRQQLGIRVLNLSWGVPSTQDPAVDPLSYAVQRLWQEGVVVVVAAGNSGPRAGTVTKPADDPLVLSVGAYDDKGDVDPANDAVTAWSSRGPTAQGLAKPDLVAPGRTLVTTRSFGSTVEQENPRALVGTSYIKGSGTSQAAAVTSGLAALLLGARPELTPDQVKHLLTSTAAPLPGTDRHTQGAGRAQLQRALAADPGPASWQSATATGLGSLEASRGGRNVVTTCPGATATVVVRGEQTARCEPWNGSTWTGSTWTGSTWTGSTWTGSTWTGSTWTDAAWAGSTWTGSTWTGSTWTGSTWTGSTWTGSTWTGSTWTGSTWTGSTWTGSTWTGSTWTGSTWTGSTWTGSTWTGNDFTTAEHDTDLLMAFTGDRPRWWQRVPGEQSEPRPLVRVPGCRGVTAC